MKLLYAQSQKNTEIFTVEEWIMRVAELDKMAKLTCLIRDTTANTFIKYWKPLSDFFF